MSRKTRDQILEDNPLMEWIQRHHGRDFTKKGPEYFCSCLLHRPDKNPSMRVNPEKQTWYCDPCGKGGTIVDLMMELNGSDAGQVLAELSGEDQREPRQQGERKPSVLDAAKDRQKKQPSKVDKVYPYLDAAGKKVYEVVRYVPKTFRQRHVAPDGSTVWNLEGVERVLYHLPDVLASSEVWITEGEKDVDTLRRLGYIATCNCGGSSGWLQAYADSLEDKDIVLIGDNDDAGDKYLERVKDSIKGRVKTLRELHLPGYKDVTECAEDAGDEKAAEILNGLYASSIPIDRGISMPVYSMAEMEAHYIDSIKRADELSFKLSQWLPGFAALRRLISGELVSVIADTGRGKSAILQNIARAAAPLPVLFFELELPEPMMFERNAAIDNDIPAWDVERAYMQGRRIKSPGFSHVYTCPLGKMTVPDMEKLIIKSELKIGQRPAIVMLDYIQLMKGGRGSRYENVSDTAEALRTMARSCGVILFVSSQVKRKESDYAEHIGIHDAKDSGSIENSSSLVIGASRPEPNTMELRILKATRGGGGTVITCNFDGPTLRITERHDLP